MYTVLKPDNSTVQMTEQQIRDFASSLNNQQSWKVACAEYSIEKVIEALKLNGFIVTLAEGS